MSVKEIQKLIERVPMMSTDELAGALKHENVLVRIGAIWEVASRNIINDDIIALLKELKKDELSFWNFIKVQDFAIAALDVLGIEKHTGDDGYIKQYIELGLKF